jgi:hypothetical protein
MAEESQKAVSRSKIEEALNEFEAYFKREVSEADAAVQSAKYSAPESYISDMKGYSRGLYHMGRAALELFRKKLISS